jgi:hypothetical protein
LAMFASGTIKNPVLMLQKLQLTDNENYGFTVTVQLL